MAISSVASWRLALDEEDEIPGTRLFRARAGLAAFEAARAIIAGSPPRHYETRWGKRMSVAMTNCGTLGWYSDRGGYRYTPVDPLTSESWPAIPSVLLDLAKTAAAEVGFPNFQPEACLVNLYERDARMGLHQDRDEAALDQPVVSISFGRSALFRFGGSTRQGRTRRMILEHGDVLVFGGPARLCYHGVTKLTGPADPVLGDRRINLTFRRVTR